MKTVKNKKKGVLTAIGAFGAVCVGLCSFAIADYAKGNMQAGAYNAGNPAPTANDLGEITLDDYATRSDGLVFNGTKLNQLYGKLVNAATGTPTASSDLATAVSKINASTSSVTGSANTGNTLTQNKALDFKTMQTQLGSPITLQFGGLNWTVMYATTNTTASTDGSTSAGDLVVTLWLNDNIGTNSQWSAATASTDMSGNYPTNMYSTSYIRINTLNAGGDDGTRAGNSATDGTTYYANSTTARASAVSLAARRTNQFAKYTLSNNVLTTTRNETDPVSHDPVTITEKPSLAAFLTMPKNVEYQRAENWVWSYMGGGNPYLCPNEAWGNGSDGVTGPNTATRHTANSRTGGWYTGSPSNMSLILNKGAYYEWSEDYLWLPSLTETGYYTSSSDYGVSLWGIPANDPIIKSTAPTGTGVTDVSWLRSGNSDYASYARGLISSGVGEYFTVSSVGGVRPALHLNLSSAALSAAVELAVPTNPAAKEYNGQNQYLGSNDGDWYDATIFGDSSICGITYVDTATNAPATPKDVGKYKATFELKTTKYSWATGDKSDKKRSITFEIKPKELEVDFHIDLTTGMPSLALKSGSAPYSTDNANEGDFVLLIHYYDSSGKDMGTDPSALEKGQPYQAVAEFGGKRGKNYAPDDKTRLNFTNPATRVKASFDPASQKYTGGERMFGLRVEDGKGTADLAVAEWAEDYGDEVSTTGNLFKAVNAGTYKVTLSLNNTDDYVWDATGRADPLTISFEIKPLDVTINLSGFTPSNYMITEGNNASAYIELNPIKAGAFTVYLAAFCGTTNFGNLCSLDMSTTVTQKTYTLETGVLPVLTYDLKINSEDCSDPAAKNYNFVLDKAYQITIKEPSSSGGLNWKLMSGGAVVGNQTDSGDTDTTTYSNKIYYSGEAYSFSINASGIDYQVDTAYNSEGFTNGYKTVKRNMVTPLASVKDAGDYTTYVRLTGESGSKNYLIHWTISKAKFDLTGVRWQDDGKLSYNEKGMSVVIDPDTLPKGLKPTIGGSHTPLLSLGTQSGKASVTFTVTDTKNYEIPVKDTDTYIFRPHDGLDDFEWEKEWTVSPTEIPVAWTIGTINASGDKKVNAEVVAGGYDSYLTYVYYETDGMGNILDPTAEPLKELTVVDGEIKYYVAEVAINDNFTGKYVLDPDATNLKSPVFEVGHLLQSVQLAAKKTAYTYWGQPISFQFTVTGSVTESAFDIVYYKGTLPLVSAPKDVGSYSAQITLKSSYTNNYFIDGKNSFDFTIERAVIKIDWNEGTKPPALKLTAEEKACVSYEYSDQSGHTVGFGALGTPGVYGVRAVIKSASQKNYIFDNDSTATGWIQFTITSSDTPVDPDSSDPFNPSIDPNNPSGGNSGGKKSVSAWLSNYSAQVGAARTQVQNGSGLPADAFEVTCTLNGNRVSDFSTAGVYQVTISLKPQYANEWVLTGQTTYSYVVTDFGADNGNTTGPNGGGNETPSEQTFESVLPVILSGASIVLIVVFAVMSLNSVAVAREATAKAKRLASMTYSFAPASLLMLFGLSQTNWWIIAGVLMGVALIMAIVAFWLKGKKRKALAALEEEQLRIDEEKEYAKEEKTREDQLRRDNEMRMMFATMQQGYQQQSTNFDALQSALVSSFSAMLPAMQQMMALPPATSDASAYNNAPAANTPNPEAEALRAQLAAQEERMAQQQEMLNQILQNQQNYAMPVYEEVVQDDVSWLGDNDEMVSLEESYGALSDEGKRFYYEVGSYIMNKPHTSQNDGKYIVLFKYRGKTIFKLCIKDNAPVLYYPAENGGRSYVYVSDEASLSLARSVIDRMTLKVDNELG